MTIVETNVTEVLTDCDKNGNLCVGIMTKEDAKYAEILKHKDEVIESLRKSVDLHQQETHNTLNSREIFFDEINKDNQDETAENQ